jgi:hypothetical protein
MSFVSRNQIVEEFEFAVSNKRENECVVTWMAHQHGIALLTYSQMRDQIIQWRHQQADIRVLRANNRTTTLNGKNWYSFVIQPHVNGKNVAETDRLALFFVGMMVNGFTYMFESEKMRNELFDSINDQTDLPPYECPELKKILELHELKNKKIAEAQKVNEEIKKLQKEKDDLQKIIDDCENREKRLNAEKELLELIESSGSDSDINNNRKKKSKKEIEKQRVKNANKERDRQKKEREAFYKRAGMI